MDKVRTKKKLQSQLNRLESDKEAKKQELLIVKREYEAKVNSIKDIKNKINSLDKDYKLKVSEHAIVRYFERVKGFDIEEIKSEILNDEVLAVLEVLGDSGKFPLGEHQIIIKNGTVTSIV